jgi:hypothetical protein
MPAYRRTLSEKEMWEISELLANADKLPGEVTNALKKPLPIDVQ